MGSSDEVNLPVGRNAPEGDKSPSLTGVTQFILLKAFASLSRCRGGINTAD